MHRRKFIQTVCIAGVGIMSGCKSTPERVHVLKKNNKLFVPLAEFIQKNTVSIAFEQGAIGVTRLIVEPSSDPKANEYTAVLLKCSHMGCAIDVNRNDMGFICPCHGAKFSPHGEVVKGPAQEPLKQFITSSNNEFVIVHLS